jgi:hypothetical protein
MADLHGNLSVTAIGELMDLCEVSEDMEIQPGIMDRHIWKFCASGDYSASSTYRVLFQGSIWFEPAERVWKSWAPQKCKFFIWLMELDRCWAAERLAKRGLVTLTVVRFVIKMMSPLIIYWSPVCFLDSSGFNF